MADFQSSKKGSELLKMFIQSFVKSCGIDDLRLISPNLASKTEIIKPKVETSKPIETSNVTETSSQPLETIRPIETKPIETIKLETVKFEKENPAMDTLVEKNRDKIQPFFATRVILTGSLTSGLNICKVREIWKTIPEAYRQDLSAVLETRSTTNIQFIVEFQKPLPGSLLANLLKWAEHTGSAHLLTIHIATQST